MFTITRNLRRISLKESKNLFRAIYDNNGELFIEFSNTENF